MLASVLGYCRAILIFGNLARFTTLYVFNLMGNTLFAPRMPRLI